MPVATAESTSVRLLDAGERLVGELGVDAVSVRAICGEVGSNVAAVHYHFGSKQGLVRAVLERRMAVLAGERARELGPLESDPQPPARAVAAVFVRPLFALSRDPEGLRYVRFLEALWRAGGEWSQLFDEAFAPERQRFLPVLARATTDLDDGRRVRRLVLASRTMLTMLADAERYAGELDDAAYLDEVIDVFTSILTAPARATS